MARPKHEACPQCRKPVLKVVNGGSTRTWVHSIIGKHVFGCTVSTANGTKH